MTAHSRLSTPLLTVAMLFVLGSGCVFTTTPNPNNGRRGDIILTWNFQGRRCFEVPDVAQIAVTIPGQALQNNGVYGCNNAGTDGIKLLNFAPGIYSYTVSAQNSQGTVIYTAQGQVTVNGDVAADVTLQPTGNATGSVYVTWSLPTGTPVTCQYLAAVDIYLDNSQTPVTVNCVDGATSPGVLLQNLSLGTHNIDISARDTNGLYYYRALNSFQVFAGGASSQQFSLQWIVGSAPLRWTFSNGTTQLNCAQAGISQVAIRLTNTQTNDVTDITAPCLNNGVQGYQIPYVYYGTYTVGMSASGTGGVPYYSTGTPVQVTVTAGSFPMVDSQAPMVLLAP